MSGSPEVRYCENWRESRNSYIWSEVVFIGILCFTSPGGDVYSGFAIFPVESNHADRDARNGGAVPQLLHERAEVSRQDGPFWTRKYCVNLQRLLSHHCGCRAEKSDGEQWPS